MFLVRYLVPHKERISRWRYLSFILYLERKERYLTRNEFLVRYFPLVERNVSLFVSFLVLVIRYLSLLVSYLQLLTCG